ncbi:T9SS type A sorting domain-containing protein [bacterium SCSIO 12741]|nr:T9SS type A sorting domain-containing protein [bacterium SCSIO 12741]
MKTNTPFYLSFLLLVWAPSLLLAQYCTPPGFLSMGGVGEPFTHIANVQIENLNNSTNLPTGQGKDIGYRHWDELPKPELTPGSRYQLNVELADNLGQGMHGVIWIDWNGDEEFDDASERVYYMPNTGTHNLTIDVPTTAKTGTIRMRIYCDMPSTMGHIDPEPCGYLNHPTHALGQHGEVEDYDLLIGASLGLEDNPRSSTLHVFPQPAQEVLNLDYKLEQGTTYSITDIYGRERQLGEVSPGDVQLDVSSLPNGQYILSIRTGQDWVKQRFFIAR